METNKGAGPENAKGFTPIILRKDGNFCVYLPEWRVTGVGATLEEAYQRYEENLRSVEAQTAQFGLASLPSGAYPALTRRVIFQELALFFTKTAVAVFATLLTIILLLPNISAAVRANLTGMIPKEIIPANLKDPHYWATQFPAKMNARLDRLTPEEEETMRKEWGHLLERVSPLVTPPAKTSAAETKAKLRKAAPSKAE